MKNTTIVVYKSLILPDVRFPSTTILLHAVSVNAIPWLLFIISFLKKLSYEQEVHHFKEFRMNFMLIIPNEGVYGQVYF